MLSAVRNWFSGKPEAVAPMCYVVCADELLRARVAGMVGEHGPQVERFSSVAALLEAAAAGGPKLVIFDIALGAEPVALAMARLAALTPRSAVQLVSATEASSYEQLCALGQAKLAADQLNLRVLPTLQPPLKSDAIRKALADLGIRSNGGKATVTLNEALKNNWLELFYQPKIDLATKRLSGAEGLIRVRHPELGVLPPGAFLPGASEQDMLAMTEGVIVAALRDWSDLAESGVSVKFSVNTPVSALTTLPLAKMLREERPKADNWPGLILEVTEDEIVNDLGLANNVASELRAHNCSLAIDDFGAGYSSLSRLRQLPFSELKIDRSYVTNCDSDRTSAGLCETIVELTKRFGLVSVAEGIETPHESHKLQGIGCRIGQGYLFAKPMSKQDLAAILRRRMVHKSESAPVQKLAPIKFNAKA
jgi:EAL domain-containing protein (putative c-di-GMP-specific phosphodiesterase class I)